MKKFSKKILVYIVSFLLILLGLDIVYTKTCLHSDKRNKIQYIINGTPKKYDAIIIGSSRAENHIDPEIFRKQGLQVYNFGMSGGNLCETSLMLKLFFEKGNTANVVLLQLDLNYQSELPAEGIKALFVPYFPVNKTIYDHYYENTPNAFYLKYIPFYRYCVYDSKIGFREIAMNLLNKSNKSISNGYSGLNETMSGQSTFELDSNVKDKNKYYDEIKLLCKKNNSQLISFEAPFCKYVKHGDFFKKLKKKNPEIYDYSNVVTHDSLFASCGHLNSNGAGVFTAFILKKHFKRN